MSYNFNPIRNPIIKRLLENIFDVATGHDHDGANSRTVAGVVGDGTVTNAKLANDVKVGSLATLDTTEKGSVVGAINENKANADNRYTKPGAGIPKSDLVAAVQASLNLADSALQEVTIASKTPVNAVAATKNLTISGVVVHGETVTIDTDIYEFAADAAQSVTPGNIAVNIAASTTKSQGTLSVPIQPVSGETITIGVGAGEKVYTFVPNGTANAEGEISVGVNVGAAQGNIVAAINGTDGHNTAHTQVSAGAFAVNDSIITALVGGVAGDTIATTETMVGAGNQFDGVTLGTTAAGVDCTNTNGAIALVAADATATVTLTRTDAVVTATAVTRGAAGNSIAIAETMANGAWAGGATELSGGVDGTVGNQWELVVDSNYFYVAIANNTISDRNWRRVALGAAY